VPTILPWHQAEDVDTRGFLAKQVQITHMDKCQVAIDRDAFSPRRNTPGLFEKAHDAVNSVRD